ncbi:MAG TPA: class I SAM-dependent methyltransferase, partial [Polyangiales bacterium]
MQDWTNEFFSPAALDAWRRAQSPELTQAEVAFLKGALALDAAPRRILDVPSGDARHAIELAKLGHHVTAIDSAADNESRARQRAAEAGVSLDFVLADMRGLPSLTPFDAAYCWGNSFGYFPRAEMQRFASALAQRLAPGARFVIDTATAAESLLVELERRSWVRIDDELLLLLECEYCARESRLDTTYTSILRDRVVDRRTAHHYVFTSGEIAYMLDSAGFATLELFEDLDGSPFELGSERLLIVAER